MRISVETDSNIALYITGIELCSAQLDSDLARSSLLCRTITSLLRGVKKRLVYRDQWLPAEEVTS